MRSAAVARTTAETHVECTWRLDGRGESSLRTGLAFFDHMLVLFARHSGTDLTLAAEGDTAVDAHHTVEDCGIVLGQALAKALGDRAGIARYGHFLLPMDETLARVALDLSGRPFLRFGLPPELDAARHQPIGGHFPLQLAEEFLRAFCVHGGVTLHAEILHGRDLHHAAEALFKGVARALDQALRTDPRFPGVPSTKGMLV